MLRKNITFQKGEAWEFQVNQDTSGDELMWKPSTLEQSVSGIWKCKYGYLQMKLLLYFGSINWINVKKTREMVL